MDTVGESCFKGLSYRRRPVSSEGKDVKLVETGIQILDSGLRRNDNYKLFGQIEE
jgi:hypothetical protein